MPPKMATEPGVSKLPAQVVVAPPSHSSRNSSMDNNETAATSYTNSFGVPLPHESFSACIMFKDDTHRLIEWLAYHYHVLPLRRVIIGVDQGSQSFPTDLADRYNDRMKITLWPKDVFAPDEEMFVSERTKKMDGANLYIRRQTLFLRKCALQLQSERRDWTIFIDPDEYLLFNYPANTTPPPTVAEDLRGIVMPSVKEEGIVYKFLQEQREKRDGTSSHANACITVPRLLFGSRVAVESSGSKNAQNLDTLQYRSHADRRDYKSNRQAKNMMDLQRFFTTQLENLKNVHRMVPEVCWSSQLTDDKALFKINHYLGSKASFFHRQDDRDQYGRQDNVSDSALLLQNTL
jgi:hypothetical protein